MVFAKFTLLAGRKLESAFAFAGYWLSIFANAALPVGPIHQSTTFFAAARFGALAEITIGLASMMTTLPADALTDGITKMSALSIGTPPPVRTERYQDPQGIMATWPALKSRGPSANRSVDGSVKYPFAIMSAHTEKAFFT